MMTVIETLQSLNVSNKQLLLYDTFEDYPTIAQPMSNILSVGLMSISLMVSCANKYEGTAIRLYNAGL